MAAIASHPEHAPDLCGCVCPLWGHGEDDCRRPATTQYHFRTPLLGVVIVAMCERCKAAILRRKGRGAHPEAAPA